VLGAWYAAEVGVILAKVAAGSSPVTPKRWIVDVAENFNELRNSDSARSGEMMTATLDGMPMTVMVAVAEDLASVTEGRREALRWRIGRIGWAV